MKVLCLTGRYTNADTLKAQLGPLQHLLKPHNITLSFLQGPFIREPPPEYVNFYGPSPHCVWNLLDVTEEQEYNMVAGDMFTVDPDVVARVGDLFQGVSTDRVQKSLDTIFQAIREDGEISGILGFSEGAAMAASVLLEEQRLQGTGHYNPRIKFAILFSGSIPMKIVGDRVQYAGIVEDAPIPIPTLHVLSPTDLFQRLSAYLFRSCDFDKAEIFVHSTGHLVPRETESLEELKQSILRLVAASQLSSTSHQASLQIQAFDEEEH
ncbi:serine hydrolase FSH [Aspergillus novoparasiticus]|uniref:Serine hydrolase FSH n=1 Tax=Aspergillus novoparasiticus TaxID=986946 RepID=A0A5N6EA79_9EURO|nr:serine hydrolase FSH [Aspergillus novoparasiticus]